MIIQKLGIVDHIKVFFVSLVFGILWFDVLYPFLKPFIESNGQISFIIFTLIYSVIVWYAASGLVNLPKNLITQGRFFLIILILGVGYDLVWFPYLVDTTGLVSNIKISSDIFVYNLLPNFIPEIIKYNIVYPFTFSVCLTLVSILSGTERVFNNVIKSGL